MKTTNYYDTFIAVAEDCPVDAAEIPPQKNDVKSVANMQFEWINKQPYKYTSDEVIFGVHAIRNDVSEKDMEKEREKFFSKGQACLRASPLAKRYGWGIHHDAEGRVAIFPIESEEYDKLTEDKNVKHVKAMRSKRNDKAKKNPEV